jgi:drug/metabolite transporter (DMT)-like permease
LPPEAIGAALFSAAIHASWNAVLKAGRDRLSVVGAMGVGGVIFGLAMLAWRGFPVVATLPFLGASAVVHVLYWLALSRSYASGDMSHVYTIARGSAPALVAIGAVLVAGEIPSLVGTVGIALVCLGIAAIGLSRTAPLTATAWAGATGLTIATYSIVDGLGARASGDAFAYIGASSIGTFVPISVYCFLRRGFGHMAREMRGDWLRAIAAGAASNAGFGLALWAQTLAPMAYVTALRETSVVFGAALAAWVLHEPVSRRRWLGAIVVAAGAIALVAQR